MIINENNKDKIFSYNEKINPCLKEAISVANKVLGITDCMMYEVKDGALIKIIYSDLNLLKIYLSDDSIIDFDPNITSEKINSGRILWPDQKDHSKQTRWFEFLKTKYQFLGGVSHVQTTVENEENDSYKIVSFYNNKECLITPAFTLMPILLEKLAIYVKNKVEYDTIGFCEFNKRASKTEFISYGCVDVNKVVPSFI